MQLPPRHQKTTNLPTFLHVVRTKIHVMFQSIENHQIACSCMLASRKELRAASCLDWVSSQFPRCIGVFTWPSTKNTGEGHSQPANPPKDAFKNASEKVPKPNKKPKTNTSNSKTETSWASNSSIRLSATWGKTPTLLVMMYIETKTPFPCTDDIRHWFPLVPTWSFCSASEWLSAWDFNCCTFQMRKDSISDSISPCYIRKGIYILHKQQVMMGGFPKFKEFGFHGKLPSASSSQQSTSNKTHLQSQFSTKLCHVITSIW